MLPLVREDISFGQHGTRHSADRDVAPVNIVDWQKFCKLLNLKYINKLLRM
jgi:hypothetical protein